MGAFPKTIGNLKNANQIFLFFMLRGTNGLNMETRVTFAHLHCHFDRAQRVEKSVLSRASALLSAFRSQRRVTRFAADGRAEGVDVPD